MGNTCIPVADSFRFLAKPTQYCKFKNKIKKKKKKKKSQNKLTKRRREEIKTRAETKNRKISKTYQPIQKLFFGKWK